MGLWSVAAKLAVKYGGKVISKGSKILSKKGVRSIFSKIDTLGEFTLNGQRAVTDAFEATKGAKFMDRAAAAYKAVEDQKAVAKAGSSNIVSKIVNSNFITRNLWAATKNTCKVAKELITLHPKRAWKALNGNLLLQTAFLYGFGVPATKDAYNEEGLWGAVKEGTKQFLKLAGGTLGMTALGNIRKIGGITGLFGWGIGEKTLGKVTTLLLGKSNSEKKEYVTKEYGVDEDDIEQYIAQGHSIEEYAALLEENRQFEIRLLKGELTDDDKTNLKQQGCNDEQIAELQSYKLTDDDIKDAGCRPEELRELLAKLQITPADIKVAKSYGNSLKDVIEVKTKELKDSHGITDSDIDEAEGGTAAKILNGTIKGMGYLNLDFEKYDSMDSTSIAIDLAEKLDDYEITKESIEQGKKEGKSLFTLLAEKDQQEKAIIAEKLKIPDDPEKRAEYVIAKLDESELGQQYAALSESDKVNPNNEIAQQYNDTIAQYQSNPPSKEEIIDSYAQESEMTVPQMYRDLQSQSDTSVAQQQETSTQDVSDNGSTQQQDVTDSQDVATEVDDSKKVDSELVSTTSDSELSLDNQVYLELIKEFIKNNDGVEVTDENLLSICQNHELTPKDMYKKLVGNENADSDETYIQKIKEIILMADQIVVSTEAIQKRCAEHNITPQQMYEKIYRDIYSSAA